MGKFGVALCENVGKMEQESFCAIHSFNLPMVWMAVSVVLIAGYVSVLAFYLYGWFRSGRGLLLPRQFRPVMVSVIVPARNEAANIPGLVRGLAAQNYPHGYYEVIIVDDASVDETVAFAQNASLQYKNFRLVSLAPGQFAHSQKKRAIEVGIGQATGEFIVCTDADCQHPPDWLAALVGMYVSKGIKFIAAPVVYETRPNLLSVFQTLDFLTLQGITAASVSTRFHTMCNGANIAYSKQVFNEVGGFQGIDKLPTGDDMLLMYKVFRMDPDYIAYLRHSHATVTTQPAPNWPAFFQQRVRWASKAAYYDDKRIFLVLLWVYFFNAWFLVLLIAGFWATWVWKLALGLLAIKVLMELAFLWPVAGFFKKRKWLWWFPFLQPLHILYTIAAGWLGRFSSYEWKGRVVEKPSALT